MTPTFSSGGQAAPAVWEFIVPAAGAGQRLDIWLARQETGLSRARLQALIRGGLATVNGRTVRERSPTRAGDAVRVALPAPAPVALVAEDAPLEILFEDNDLVVVNKPAGMVVYPAAGHPSGTLVNALLHHCRGALAVGDRQRPGIVHRLDRDTSGAIVAAKTDRALAGLAAQFERHTVGKEYVALVWGRPVPAQDRIEARIGRHSSDRRKMAVHGTRGRTAVTRYAIVEELGPVSLVRLRIETGRTHQIRVHMAHRGHPLLGDAKYGGLQAHRALPAPAARQMLHAETLAFAHPVSGRPLTVAAPWPDDLRTLIEALRRTPIRVS